MTSARALAALVIIGVVMGVGIAAPARGATDPAPAATGSSRSRVPLIRPDQMTTDLGKKLYEQANHDASSLVGTTSDLPMP